MPNSYEVTVKGPDGEELTILLPKEQVEFFKTDADGDTMQTALWLAYADRWATK